MRIINRSPYRDADGGLLPGADKLAAKEFGPDWKKLIDGEDRIAAAIDAILDERYVLIREANLPLVGPIEMILLGPTGVHILSAHHLEGMYKAEGEEWQRYDSGQMEFSRDTENPIERARAASSHLREVLHSRNLPVPFVNAAVVMSSMDTQLTLEAPVVNIIAFNEIEHFISTDVLAGEVIMDAGDVSTVEGVILEHALEPEKFDLDRSARSGFFGMNRRQLIVLGGMAVLDLCLLGGFAFLVLRNTLGS